MRLARQRGALLLVGAAASCAPWGALASTWAPRGQPRRPAARGPDLRSPCRRKAYTVFGLIAYVTGRLFSPGQTARFPAQSYGASLTTVLDAAQRDENSLVRDYTVRELEAFIDLLVAAR